MNLSVSENIIKKVVRGLPTCHHFDRIHQGWSLFTTVFFEYVSLFARWVCKPDHVFLISIY